METNKIKLKTILIALSGICLIEFLASFPTVPETAALLKVGVIRMIDILFLVGVSLYSEGTLGSIGIARPNTAGGIRRGILWSLAVGVLTVLAFGLLFLFGTNPLPLIRTPLPKDHLLLVQYFLVGGIIAPVAEELFFRGIVFGFLRRIGFWFALVFSTLIFAFLHAVSSGIPIPQLLGGVLFACAFEMEKNLLPPIILHMAGNLAIFTISLLPY